MRGWPSTPTGPRGPAEELLRPCLLLLLHESPAHGYELRERLRPLGFNRDDPGRCTGALRLSRPRAGALGLAVLDRAGPTAHIPAHAQRRGTAAPVSAELQAMHAILDGFLSRGSESSALDTHSASAPAELTCSAAGRLR